MFDLTAGKLAALTLIVGLVVRQDSSPVRAAEPLPFKRPLSAVLETEEVCRFIADAKLERRTSRDNPESEIELNGDSRDNVDELSAHGIFMDAEAQSLALLTGTSVSKVDLDNDGRPEIRLTRFNGSARCECSEILLWDEAKALYRPSDNEDLDGLCEEAAFCGGSGLSFIRYREKNYFLLFTGGRIDVGFFNGQNLIKSCTIDVGDGWKIR